LQRWLANWITEYIDGDPKNSSELTKCRRPLAGAKISIVENEEEPGLLLGDIRTPASFSARGHGHRLAGSFRDCPSQKTSFRLNRHP